jgi:general secretion pathway protein M
MSGRPGKTYRQLSALLILILGTAALASVTILPLWLANRHFSATIDTMQDRLDALQRVAASGPASRAEYEQLKRLRSTYRHHLQSNSESLAAAELQRMLKRIATSQKMEVYSIQNVPAEAENGFTRIALKARMRGTLDNIVGFFYAIETGEPFLFLENTSIRSLARQLRTASSVRQTLETDFELVGYIPEQR